MGARAGAGAADVPAGTAGRGGAVAAAAAAASKAKPTGTGAQPTGAGARVETEAAGTGASGVEAVAAVEAAAAATHVSSSSSAPPPVSLNLNSCFDPAVDSSLAMSAARAMVQRVRGGSWSISHISPPPPPWCHAPFTRRHRLSPQASHHPPTSDPPNVRPISNMYRILHDQTVKGASHHQHVTHPRVHHGPPRVC